MAFHAVATNFEGVPHTWKWSVTWLRFRKSGQVTTTGSSWDASEAFGGTGGLLTVQAAAGNKKASISAQLQGTNPTGNAVVQYLKMQPNSIGFDKILQHESRMTHFTFRGEPKRALIMASESRN